jgi:hypothetical protein
MFIAKEANKNKTILRYLTGKKEAIFSLPKSLLANLLFE